MAGRSGQNGAPNSGDVQSVMLAIRVLETLGAAEGALGVSQLAEMLGVTKARVHRHLRTLHRLGCVVQDPESERYVLGLRPLIIAPAEGLHRAMRTVARMGMRELAERLGLTVVLSARAERELVIVAVARSGRGMEVITSLGETLDFSSSVQGRIAVASMEEPERERALGFQPSDEQIAEYEALRARGWAAGHNESEDVNLLAAPILVAPRTPVGTIALLGPGQRVPLAPPSEMVGGLTALARRIGDHLVLRPEAGLTATRPS